MQRIHKLAAGDRTGGNPTVLRTTRDSVSIAMAS